MEQHRPLYEIARDIRSDWKKVNYAAVPYLLAMHQVHNIKSEYGADNGESIVLYFLVNAGTWRGEIAKRIKAELKAIVK